MSHTIKEASRKQTSAYDWTIFNDAPKALDDFKNKQKSVWSNIFWYVKVFIFWKSIQYTIHWDKTQMLKEFPSHKRNDTKNILFFLISQNIFLTRRIIEIIDKVNFSRDFKISLSRLRYICFWTKTPTTVSLWNRSHILVNTWRCIRTCVSGLGCNFII